MATKYVCDRCGKEKQHGDLFELRTFSRDDCHNIPSGILFGLQGEYCEDCTKILQKVLQTKVQNNPVEEQKEGKE